MGHAQIVKPPKKNICHKNGFNFITLALGLNAYVHYATTIVYKEKEIKIPICGAISTFMTDDITLCNCPRYRSSFLRKVCMVGVNIKTEGEKNNEEKSDTNGLYS